MVRYVSIIGKIAINEIELILRIKKFPYCDVKASAKLQLLEYILKQFLIENSV